MSDFSQHCSEVGDLRSHGEDRETFRHKDQSHRGSKNETPAKYAGRSLSARTAPLFVGELTGKRRFLARLLLFAKGTGTPVNVSRETEMHGAGVRANVHVLRTSAVRSADTVAARAGRIVHIVIHRNIHRLYTRAVPLRRTNRCCLETGSSRPPMGTRPTATTRCGLRMRLAGRYAKRWVLACGAAPGDVPQPEGCGMEPGRDGGVRAAGRLPCTPRRSRDCNDSGAAHRRIGYLSDTKTFLKIDPRATAANISPCLPTRPAAGTYVPTDGWPEQLERRPWIEPTICFRARSAGRAPYGHVGSRACKGVRRGNRSVGGGRTAAEPCPTRRPNLRTVASFELPVRQGYHHAARGFASGPRAIVGDEAAMQRGKPAARAEPLLTRRTSFTVDRSRLPGVAVAEAHRHCRPQGRGAT